MSTEIAVKSAHEGTSVRAGMLFARIREERVRAVLRCTAAEHPQGNLPMTEMYAFRAIAGKPQMITDDKTGAKLPPSPSGPWVFIREIRVLSGFDLVGAHADDVIENVAKDGYYQWSPETDEFSPEP